MSRAELDARSNRRARQLAALGAAEQDVVTVALPNGFEFYETAFAIWKLGATLNPVSARLPAAEIRAIIELACPSLVVGAAPDEGSSWNYLAADTEPGASLSDGPLPTKVSKAWKIMTSGGSTGRPKLIVNNRPGLFDPMVPMLGLNADDIMLNPGPLYHNSPLATTMACLFTGGHVGDGPVRCGTRA